MVQLVQALETGRDICDVQTRKIVSVQGMQERCRQIEICNRCCVS